MNDNSIDLDLDALTSNTKKIKLNGKEFTITPPDVAELFELMSVGKKLRKMNSQDMSEEDAMNAFELMKDAFIKIIPELKGEKVSIEQLFALLQLVTKMAIPSNVKAMEEAGVKIDSTQKKTLSDGSEK